MLKILHLISRTSSRKLSSNIIIFILMIIIVITINDGDDNDPSSSSSHHRVQVRRQWGFVQSPSLPGEITLIMTMVVHVLNCYNVRVLNITWCSCILKHQSCSQVKQVIHQLKRWFWRCHSLLWESCFFSFIFNFNKSITLISSNYISTTSLPPWFHTNGFGFLLANYWPLNLAFFYFYLVIAFYVIISPPLHWHWQ